MLGPWCCSPWGRKESDTTGRLNNSFNYQSRNKRRDRSNHGNQGAGPRGGRGVTARRPSGRFRYQFCGGKSGAFCGRGRQPCVVALRARDGDAVRGASRHQACGLRRRRRAAAGRRRPGGASGGPHDPAAQVVPLLRPTGPEPSGRLGRERPSAENV